MLMYHTFKKISDFKESEVSILYIIFRLLFEFSGCGLVGKLKAHGE